MQIGQKRTRVDGPCVNRRGLLAASFKNRTEEQRDTSGTHLNRTAVEPVRFETLTRTAAYTQHGTSVEFGGQSQRRLFTQSAARFVLQFELVV